MFDILLNTHIRASPIILVCVSDTAVLNEMLPSGAQSRKRHNFSPSTADYTLFLFDPSLSFHL